MFAFSFLNWHWTQKKTLPMRHLIYSIVFIKCIKKNYKKNSYRWGKTSKAIVENKLTAMIKILSWDSIDIVNFLTFSLFLLTAFVKNWA